MILCFDTSGINALLDDADHDEKTARILSQHTVYVSGLNVIEAGMTSDTSRRVELIRLMKQLSSGRRPLEIPNALVRRMVRAYHLRRESIEICVDDQQDGIWIAMNVPEEILEEDRRELLRWHRDMESEFRTMHQNARPSFQALFDPSGHNRPCSASALLRGFISSDQFILDVVNGIYERENGTRLALPEVRSMLRTIPAFALFLLGWAHAVYTRSVQPWGYGTGNAGNIDLWQATYLHFCDVFVTNDHKQYQALRLINKFNQRGTQVVEYKKGFARLIAV